MSREHVLFSLDQSSYHDQCFTIPPSLINNLRVELPSLPGIQFTECSIQSNPACQYFVVNYGNHTVTIHASEYYQEKDTVELLDIISGKVNLAFERRYLLSQKSHKKITSALLRAMVFNLDNTWKHHAVTTIHQIILETVFDLSDIDFNNQTAKELAFIDGLLAFKSCMFRKGIMLPDFILDRCSDKNDCIKKLSGHINSDAVTTILLNVRDQLQKIMQSPIKHDRKLSTDEFMKSIKNKRKNFKGCEIGSASAQTFESGVIEFSNSDDKQIHQIDCDVSNARFKKPVNFCHVRLSQASFQNTPFEKGFLFDDKTDFREYKSTVMWPATMPITYVLPSGEWIKTTPLELYTTLCEKYVAVRGGRGKKTFSDDQITKVSARFPGEENAQCGSRLFALLQHVQHQENKGSLTSVFSRHQFMHMAFHQAINALKVRQSALPLEPATLPASPRTRTHSVATQSVSPSTSEIFAMEKAALLQSAENTRRDLRRYFENDGVVGDHSIVNSQDKFSALMSDYDTHCIQGMRDAELSAAIARRVAASEILLFRALGSLQSVDMLNNDLPSEAERGLHENTILCAYILLAVTNHAALTLVHEKLRQLYLQYLKHVVYNEKHVDASGNRLFLRYNLVEKLLATSRLIPDSDSLSLLSRKRHEIIGGKSALFVFKKTKGDSAFKKHCQREWTMLSFRQLVHMNFIPPLISDKVFIAMRDHRDLDETVQRQLERQHYLLALMQAGDYKTAACEFAAFRQGWPEAKLHVDIFQPFFFELVSTAVHYPRNDALLEFLRSPLKHLIENDSLTGADIHLQMSLLEKNQQWIMEGESITKILKMIADNLLKKACVTHDNLRMLRICINKKLLWGGKPDDQVRLCVALTEAGRSPAVSQAYVHACESLCLIIAQATPIQSLNYTDSEKLIPVLMVKDVAIFQRSLFQTQQAVSLIQNALSPLYHYHAFKKIKVNDKLQENLTKETADKKIDNVNENFSKYEKAIRIQQIVHTQCEQLLQLESTVDHEKIDFAFVVVLNQLRLCSEQLVEEGKAHKTRFGVDPSFYDCLETAIRQLENMQKTWYTVLRTLFSVGNPVAEETATPQSMIP